MALALFPLVCRTSHVTLGGFSHSKQGRVMYVDRPLAITGAEHESSPFRTPYVGFLSHGSDEQPMPRAQCSSSTKLVPSNGPSKGSGMFDRIGLGLGFCFCCGCSHGIQRNQPFLVI